MIPVLSSSALRYADAWTIEHEPISPWALMERAATRFAAQYFKWLQEHGALAEARSQGVLVVCGMGNNGGDGFAVARLLSEKGLRVQVVRVQHRQEPSAENATNHALAIEAGLDVVEVPEGGELDLRPNGLMIDALLGTGLKHGIKGWLGNSIDRINAARYKVVSIDIPSGLFAERVPGDVQGAVVNAAATFTFQVPKLAFYFAENAQHAGDITILPIGLDNELIAQQPTEHFQTEERDVLQLLPQRPRFAHKGTFGHVLLIAGSLGRVGAAVLSTRAALRTGVGLVTAYVPRVGVDILQVAAPEAMCSSSEDEVLPMMTPFAAVAFGPGMGTGDATAKSLKQLLQMTTVPLVVDADGLNVLAANPTWLAFLPGNTILTPHPKEFDRLVQRECRSGEERLQRAREAAVKWRCHIVLKGAWTAVIDPAGVVRFNPTGNPGMAKGGSGDALTGLLAGLLAQGCIALNASLLGVYLHGLAGDLAAEHIGMDGMLASDLVDAIPAAWQKLRRRSEEMLR